MSFRSGCIADFQPFRLALALLLIVAGRASAADFAVTTTARRLRHLPADPRGPVHAAGGDQRGQQPAGPVEHDHGPGRDLCAQRDRAARRSASRSRSSAPAATATIISGNGLSRVFTVSGEEQLALRDLTVADGSRARPAAVLRRQHPRRQHRVADPAERARHRRPVAQRRRHRPRPGPCADQLEPDRQQHGLGWSRRRDRRPGDHDRAARDRARDRGLDDRLQQRRRHRQRRQRQQHDPARTGHGRLQPARWRPGSGRDAAQLHGQVLDRRLQRALQLRDVQTRRPRPERRDVVGLRLRRGQPVRQPRARHRALPRGRDRVARGQPGDRPRRRLRNRSDRSARRRAARSWRRATRGRSSTSRRRPWSRRHPRRNRRSRPRRRRRRPRPRPRRRSSTARSSSARRAGRCSSGCPAARASWRSTRPGASRSARPSTRARAWSC